MLWLETCSLQQLLRLAVTGEVPPVGTSITISLPGLLRSPLNLEGKNTLLLRATREEEGSGVSTVLVQEEEGMM